MILAAAATMAALAYWRVCTASRHGWGHSALKTASVGLLALLAWRHGAPVTIALGLALGSAGDFFLSRPGKPAFLAGMAAFAAGHLAYALNFLGPFPAAIALPALAMLALAVSTEFWLIPHSGDLRWPVRLYVAIIALMAVTAMTLPAARWPAVAGAGLFVLSDLMLAIHLFRTPRTWLSRALWPVYWTGQALILTGSIPHP